MQKRFELLLKTGPHAFYLASETGCAIDYELFVFIN